MNPALITYIQGQAVASADNLNTLVQQCNTFSDLRSFTGFTNMVVLSKGGNAINDGLGGSFYWNSTAVGPDDNANFIVPTGALSGAWIRIVVPGSGGGGTGNVLSVGTPTNGQAAVWTDAIHIQGITASLIAGSNITISGTWPNQTVASTAGGTGYTLTPQDSVTAHPGGGFASAVAITGNVVTVTTVASDLDSVIVPAAVAASATPIMMSNLGANRMQVFAAGGTTINGLAGTTGIAQLPSSFNIFTVSVNGAYRVAGMII
jgi:hypothetical protein